MKKLILIACLPLGFFFITCNLKEIEEPPSGCTIPIANFSVDQVSGDAPLTVNFTNNSSGASSYKWDFQQGPTSTTEEPGSRLFSNAGNYSVQLIASAGVGCADTFTLVIMVVEPQAPVHACAQVTAQSNNGAAPTAGSFSAVCSANATSFSWDFGDPSSGAANTAAGVTTAHTYSTAGSYNVKLSATGPAGTDDTTIVVSVAHPPVKACAQVTAKSNNGVAPSVVGFSALCSENAATYAWDFGDPSTGAANSATGATPSHAYITQGTFNVKLTATGPAGSKDTTIIVAITQMPTPPVAQFSITNGGCIAPCDVVFTNTSTDATSFEWNFGDGSSNVTMGNPTHKYEVPGDYIVTLTATGPGGTDMEIKPVLVNALTFKKSFGGSDADDGYSVQQTSDGGYILLGTTASEGAGQKDLYLIKTDIGGTMSWKKTFGGTNIDEGRSVQQTSDGGYILLGTTASEGNAGNNFYLVKTNSSGTLSWKKTFGGSGGDSGSAVQQTSDGGYILSGYTNSTGAGSQDAYLIKTDNSGSFLWEKTFGGTGLDFSFSVQQTTDNGYILLGYTTSEGAGQQDLYLVKTDNAGNLVWKKTFGGASGDYGESVQQTADGGYVLLGRSNSEGAGSFDFFLVKTDNAGNLSWKKTFGGTGSDSGYSVQQTADGGYILLGSTSSEGAGFLDFYLIKTDGVGNLSWKNTFGDSSYDTGYAVKQTADGGYILLGYTQNPAGGVHDFYLVKTDKDGKTQ